MRLLQSMSLFGILTAAAIAQPESVAVLWGSGDRVPIEAISDEGLVESGTGRLVPLSRVERVEGEESSAFAGLRPLARDVWRGVSRLERGDAAGAEPLLERAAERLAGGRGPTSRVVAEGLVRCRLSRGAVGAATESWLWWVTCGGPRGERAIMLSPLASGQTALVPELPPIFSRFDPDETRWAVTEPRGLSADLSSEAQRLSRWYRAAASWAAGETAELSEVASAPAETEAIAIVRDVVLAQAGGLDERAAARRRIRARLGGGRAEPWVEAWCRIAAGRSLIVDGESEGDREAVMLGVAELLHLPARLGGIDDRLTRMACADAAAALRRQGDADGADAVLDALSGIVAGATAAERSEQDQFREQWSSDG